MDSDRNVSATELKMWASWTAATFLILAGAFIGLTWRAIPEMRMVALSLFGVGILAEGGAVCCTIKWYLQRQYRQLAGLISTRSDAERRLRGISG